MLKNTFYVRKHQVLENAQSFLENTAKLDFMQSREILLWGIALGTPFFLVFGALSDKIGRKWIMIIGMLLGAICYRPIFSTFLHDTNIEQMTSDIHKVGAPFYVVSSTVVKADTISSANSIATTTKTSWMLPNKMQVVENRTDTLTNFNAGLNAVLKKDSKPVFNGKILPNDLKWKFVFLVWGMIIFVTMAYGPIAAFLVELFPTKIRYTSMSLPYHIGNGVFGGLVPFIATLLSVSFTNDPLVGLWYPIGIALLCAVIGMLFLNNKIDKNVND